MLSSEYSEFSFHRVMYLVHRFGLPTALTLFIYPALLFTFEDSVNAQVRFDNCQPVSGGGVTCNTVPYGNTRTQMIDGEYGLLDQASPGWAEYDPYEGYEDMFGGNQT